MFSLVNIQDELLKTRRKHAQVQHSLIQQVEEAKKKGIAIDEFLLKRLHNAPKPGKWQVNSELLDKKKIFSVDDIKSICIQYRLRFLDSKYFKIEGLPTEEVKAIKNLEKELGKEIRSVKMLASLNSFRQENINNTMLLFAEMDENNFYLVHKLGNGFSRYKKIISFPFRSILSLLITCIIIGLPVAFIVPAFIFNTPEKVQYYQMLYLAGFTVSVVFIMVFGGFTFYKKFSRICWNRPYFN
jgi:hypothetical protein